MIRRQDTSESDLCWQPFEVPRYPNMNVVECLMEIRKNPVDAEGKHDAGRMGGELPRGSVRDLYDAGERKVRSLAPR
jgi:hypothetical protein